MPRRACYLVALFVCCVLALSSPSLFGHDDGTVSLRSDGSWSSPLMLVQAHGIADDEFDAFDAPADDDNDDVVVEQARAAADASAAASAPSSKPAAASVAAASALDLDEDAADLLADDDEFVGAAELAKTATSAKEDKKARAKAAKAAAARSAAEAAAAEPTIGNVTAAPGVFFQPIGALEFVGAALIVAFLINWIRGARANRVLAEKVATAIGPVLEDAFAQVGETSSKADLPCAYRLIHESSDRFSLFCSGRRGVECALVAVELQPRQDLLSLALGLADLAVSRDTLTIDIPLAAETAMSAGSGPFVFALLRKKQAKKLVKGIEDLEGLMSAPSKLALPKGMDGGAWTVLSDVGAEVEENLLSSVGASPQTADPRLARTLAAGSIGESLLLSAHVSDSMHFPFAASQRGARFRFLLPSRWDQDGEGSEVDALQSLVRLALSLADRASELRLSPAGRARAEARRKKAQEALAKQSAAERAEAARLKKEEQRRKEAELIAANPNSEAARELLRKKEQREAKMAKKAQGRNVKVMR